MIKMNYNFTALQAAKQALNWFEQVLCALTNEHCRQNIVATIHGVLTKKKTKIVLDPGSEVLIYRHSPYRDLLPIIGPYFEILVLFLMILFLER